MSSEYKNALEWLFQQTSSFIKSTDSYRQPLENMHTLTSSLGNPQNQYPTIHIAGTNGKGSTSNMVASILIEAGYKVGIFTSPHLKNFTERIKINNVECSEKFVLDFITQYKKEDNIYSFFELTTTMAFTYFAQEKVDIAIIEVGLGGRLDSTNIITPLVSAITSISKDHTHLLGNTLEEIAMEKSGIIKPKIPIVIGEQEEGTKKILIQEALQNKAPYTEANKIKTQYMSDLAANYQLQNIKTAIGIIYNLKNTPFHISEKNIKQGLLSVRKNTSFRGRWEILQESPLIICDIAHNEAGIKQVISQVKAIKYNKLHIITGFVKDKDIPHLVSLLPKEATYYLTLINSPRSANPEEYQKYFSKDEKKYTLFKSSENALKQAKLLTNQEDVILITGSNFLISDFF